MPIRVLPPALAARIAAGEVVERPASVVKELVENSIDAGASQITVELRSGGLDLIRIIDNGGGIPPAEAPLAFHRHATSKLTDPAQLDCVATMGFRGEALPSIAAVSRVALQTRPPGENAGFRMTLLWGEPLESGSDGCAPGTVLEVTQLFGNQPARRKFLRSPQAETGRAQEAVSRYALAYPEIRFRLLNDGRPLLSTPGNGQPREALQAVYGAPTAANMLEVHAQDPATGYAVEGYAAPPNINRANRTYMIFFVNRRWIQNRMLAHAVEEAYTGLLPVKRYPVAVVNLVMPYTDVDVNSHPAKREIRFHHDRQVFAITQRAVRSAVVSGAPPPSFDKPRMNRDGEAGIGPDDESDMGRDDESGMGLGYGAGVGPARVWSPGGGRPSGGRSGAGMTGFPPYGGAATGADALALLGRPTVPLRVVGQLKQTYIVAEGAEGMYLIDQHAAHERVVFDRLITQRDGRDAISQSLLSPQTVELSPSHAAILGENLPSLTAYGFQLEPFGDGSYLLRAIPSLLVNHDPAQALIDVLDMATLEGLTRQKEDIMAASIACHGAIRAGQTLTEPEMRSLLEQLETTPNPQTCPHGRPTMVHFSSYHVERGFGRR